MGSVQPVLAFKPAVSKSEWIGRAIGLALFSVSLPSCNRGESPTSQNQPQLVEAGALEWSERAQEQLLEAIAEAPANGLKPDLFLKGDLPKDDAERNDVLTRAALRYAQALAHGYTDPKTVSAVYTIPRPSVDFRRALADAVRRGSVDQWLASLPPQTDEYRALSQAHLAYLKMASETGFQPVPGGKPIKAGSNDPRVRFVTDAMVALGYLPAISPSDPPAMRYNGALLAAVKQLQIDFGLKPDGIIGAATLDALNLGPAGRARQLAIAMERLRWLERSPPATRIDVNIAGAFLDYWRSGEHVSRRNVVPGEPDKPTPQIQAPIVELVANPYWRIPDSIYEEELAAKSSAYFAENQMVFKEGKLVQLPGPKNSLGLVKFDMDDPQQIYLHDTPFKELFALEERHRSHGCVRVEGAIDFAATLASEDGVLDRFEEGLASGDESYVKLKTRIPVRLLYHTAYWDGSRIQFRPDVYGWDDNVAMALGLVRGPARRNFEYIQEIGP